MPPEANAFKDGEDGPRTTMVIPATTNDNDAATADGGTAAAAAVGGDGDSAKRLLLARQHRPPHPYVESSFLSKLLFVWPYRLMDDGQRRRNRIRDYAGASSANGENDDDGGGHDDASILRESDLPDVLHDDASGTNLRRFNDMWKS